MFNIFKRKVKKIQQDKDDMRLALELTLQVLTANPARKTSVTDEILNIYQKSYAVIIASKVAEIRERSDAAV